MTENTSHEEPETNEPTVLFGIQTPLGKMEIDPSDLPEGLRNALLKGLEAHHIPERVRATFAKMLDPGAPAGEGTDTGEGDDDPEKMPAGSQEFDCSCAADSHREQVWDIVDTTFPNEPHLWNAMESLFRLSAVNPEKLTDEARLATIRTATLHLNRHIEVSSSPLSHEEQLVADFRKQLGL